MNLLSDQAYLTAFRAVQKKNEIKKRKLLLKEEKNKYKNKPLSTSKLMAVYLFIMLNVVLIYAMVTMWHFGDLTYLGVLITDVVAQILTYFIYMKKATIENKSGGITYELAMRESENKPTPERAEPDNVGTEVEL